MRPLIVSFATKGAYEELLSRLVQSAKAHGFDVYTEIVEPRPTWEGNCLLKPQVIARAMRTTDRPVLFLDADIWLKRDVPIFDEWPAEMAAVRSQPERIGLSMEALRYRRFAAECGGMWESGILYMQQTSAIRAILQAWERENAEHPSDWDQINMQRAFLSVRPQPTYVDVPQAYRVDGKFLGHSNAFHRIHAPTRPQRWLLLGSAPYVEDWWKQNGQAYVDGGFFIAAMNNAWRVLGKDMHAWLRPNNFRGERPSGRWFFEQPDGWEIRPYWERDIRVSFIDIATHLLNVCAAKKRDRWIELHVAGSDFIYPDDGRTHFYGAGTADPLRFGIPRLERALNRLRRSYERESSLIVNVGGQAKTLLPFARR